MANDKFMFDLRTPIAVSKEDFYLSLIDALVTELRKYTEVEIVNEQILVNFKIRLIFLYSYGKILFCQIFEYFILEVLQKV